MSNKSRAKDEELKKAFQHTLGELEIQNMLDSLRKADFEKFQKAHDSVHEFMYLAPLCLLGKASWHQKSAFFTYQWEAFHSAHRASIEVLAGYYNAGYVLLRNTLELLIKGALWECLAHENFRDRAEAIKKSIKIGKSKKTLLDWFEDIIKREPSIKEDLEKTSGGIFDKIAPLPEDPILWKLIPRSVKIKFY